MSVESICIQIGKTIDTYKTRLDEINKNGNLSEDYKKRLLNEAYRESAPIAERQIKALWGDVTEDSDGRKILSDDGAVWSAMNAAEKAQFEGKQKFLSTRYKNPELIPILAARINGKMRASMSGRDFSAAYEAMSTDERNYCQDMGADLFNGRAGADWQHARAKIAVDLKAAEALVFDPLQAAVNKTVENAWELALPAYRAAANAFGRESFYIQSVEKGIDAHRVGFGYEVDRKSWGVHFANRGKITHYEAPSAAFPKARKTGK